MAFLKKSQAALEFIMTYGWAILVVLVAIGALAYFGVLSPDRFLPERCTLPAGVSCLDQAAYSSIQEIDVNIKNSLGVDITSITVDIAGCTSSFSTPSLKNGASVTAAPTSCTLTAGQKYSGQINFTYTNPDTGISHKLQGTLIMKVQS